MKYTIQKMSEPSIFFEGNKEIRLNGYAFIDEFDKCMMIVYGERRRDFMGKYFSGPTDELHIKYQYVDLNKSQKSTPPR